MQQTNYLLSPAVLAGGSSLLGMNVCLDLGVGLRTDRDLVLWGRRLSRRGIPMRRRLHL
jgi:hypothetical protein